MQQIKTFIGREDHTEDLETEVNGWIASSGVNVISITGNIAPQSILPAKDAGGAGALGGGGAPSRRFAPSDLFILVTYEKG